MAHVGSNRSAYPEGMLPDKISLRNWFAGMAIASAIRGVAGPTDLNNAASVAYALADAMLKEREK